ADFKSLQDKVDNAIARDEQLNLVDGSDLKNRLDQSGRKTILISSTLAGGIFVGPGLATYFDKTSENQVLGSVLVGAGSGLLASHLLTRKKEVNYSTGILTSSGLTSGLIHSIGLALTLNNFKPKTISLAFATIIPAEIIGGYQLAKYLNPTPGEAQLIATMTAGLGPIMGLLAPAAAGSQNISNYGIGIFAGSVGGFFGAKFLYSRNNYSLGDVYVFSTVVPVIMLSAFSIATINPNNQIFESRTGFSLALGSSLVGIGLADYLLKSTDFTLRQGKRVAFSSLIGGLAGLVLGGISGAEERTFLLISTGAIAGLGMGYSRQKNKNNQDLSFLEEITISPSFVSVERNIKPGVTLSIKFN
ncbi:MAG: hypothetical protein ACJATA_001270, partial [Sphingobacteriales bacterium]